MRALPCYSSTVPRRHPPSLNPYLGQTASLMVMCAAIVLLGPWCVSAQEIQREPDGTVSIRAAAIPLGRLLEAVARVAPFQKLVLDPSTANRPVSVTLSAVSMRQALTDILRAAEVDYALATDEDGRSLRLIAGDKTFVASAVRARTATPPPSVAAERVEDVAVFKSQDQGSADSSTTDAPDTGAGIAGQPANSSAEVWRSQELERALSVPPLRVPPGGMIELPFPGPDGLPLVAIMPPKGTPRVLPFPNAPLPKASVAQPASAATPRPGASPVADPHLQELIEALAPKPGSGK